MLEEKNRVIVRIWTSRFHHTHPGESVGHVSLEIPHIQITADNQENQSLYISLWPQRALPSILIKKASNSSNEQVGYFFQEPHQFLLNAHQDKIAERRPPEITLCLYSLDINKIHSAFQEKKQNLSGWVLFGGNILASAAESCSTLAGDMLIQGDINGFIKTGTIQSSVSPDQLADAVHKAKKQENVLFQAERQEPFYYPEETSIENPVRKCPIL